MSLLLPYGGASPQIGENVYQAESATIIGDVVVGDSCSIWFQTVIRGDVFPIRIGHRTNIQDFTMIHVTTGKYATQIGDDVTVGHRVTLHGCTIGSRCLIGMGAIIMDQAVIEDECLIGAGALVTPGTHIPAGSLVVGAPAKVKRKLEPGEIENIKHAAMHYIDIAAGYA
jgi:carbonic anhydrase/acetyltransferase-like protein (isoleucine patch superfamily)